MQQIAITQFSFNKTTQVLCAMISDIQHLIQTGRLLAYEPFEIVGKRETRRYCLHTVEREQARNEIGDIQAWIFRPVDRFGRSLPGPQLTLFND